MMVSAYASGLRLTLATLAAKDHNEVDAGLEAIGLIDFKGKIVTADSLLSDARACLAQVDDPKAKKRCRGQRARPQGNAHRRCR